jgi:asparagine synthase (glutamine-hydrolysing)
MGGILFGIINKSSEFNFGNDFLTSFNNLQSINTSSTFEIVENIDINKMRQDQLKLILSKRQIYEYKNYSFVFGKHSLFINDQSYDAHQPFEYPIDHFKLQHKELMTIPQKKMLFSGEIYNHIELKENYKDFQLISDTDCQVILPMYTEFGIEETLRKLDGEFSFILTDNLDTCKLSDMNIFVVRDRFGTKSMYIIFNEALEIYFFTSELKCIPNYILADSDYTVSEIPPGSYWSYQNTMIQMNTELFINYYNLQGFKDPSCITITKTDPDTLNDIYKNVSTCITKSIIEKIPQGRFGILLSGGFDSSLISSIICSQRRDNFCFFTIGNGNDNESAKELIDFLEKKYDIVLEHHNVTIDIEDILVHLPETINKIIKLLEMYDPDTIRDTIPYIYLFDYIQSHCPDIRVLISGDSLDEIANGYPESENSDFITTNVNLISNICKFDLSRTEKLSSFYGIEMRYPFLNSDFIEYYLTLSVKLRSKGVFNIDDKGQPEFISKFIIRKSFTSDILPFEIMWRELSWSAQCIDSLEPTLNDYFEKVHGVTQLEYYKGIYNSLYPIEFSSKLWIDNFNQKLL